eukprot:c4136_g1_i1.p1 GENE.c4136_g1_i1~~c4136_g1_i1.p1  ORF type:complete len:307 (+),score=83.20 c4136_g1_i1:50-970(+)
MMLSSQQQIDLAVEFFLPNHFEELCIEAQQLILQVASKEHQSVHTKAIKTEYYQSGFMIPIKDFIASNIGSLTTKDQIEAVNQAILQKNQYDIRKKKSCIIVYHSLRNNLCSFNPPWIRRYMNTINIATKYFGKNVVTIGDYLSTPFGCRELSQKENKCLSIMLNESELCEKEETPNNRKFIFPWKSALRMCYDFLGLRCERILNDPKNNDKIFSTFCLFFGLLRVTIIEYLKLSPSDYYENFGDDYKKKGWTSSYDLRLGTPVFMGPAGLVESLISPTIKISEFVRIAVRVKEENTNQLFVRYIL